MAGPSLMWIIPLLNERKEGLSLLSLYILDVADDAELPYLRGVAHVLCLLSIGSSISYLTFIQTSPFSSVRFSSGYIP